MISFVVIGNITLNGGIVAQLSVVNFTCSQIHLLNVSVHVQQLCILERTAKSTLLVLYEDSDMCSYRNVLNWLESIILL